MSLLSNYLLQQYSNFLFLKCLIRLVKSAERVTRPTTTYAKGVSCFRLNIITKPFETTFVENLVRNLCFITNAPLNNVVFKVI